MTAGVIPATTAGIEGEPTMKKTKKLIHQDNLIRLLRRAGDSDVNSTSFEQQTSGNHIWKSPNEEGVAEHPAETMIPPRSLRPRHSKQKTPI